MKLTCVQHRSGMLENRCSLSFVVVGIIYDYYLSKFSAKTLVFLYEVTFLFLGNVFNCCLQIAYKYLTVVYRALTNI